MNQISIKFFASIADITGAREIERMIPDGSTVRDLLAYIYQEYPSLKIVKDNIITVLNMEFVGMDQIIPPYATIALFPPVSGG